MISDRELAAMTANETAALPDRCDIVRPASVSDGQGGQTVTWATVYASVPCSVAPQPVHESERPIAGRLSAQGGWLVTVPAGTDVRASDRVVALDRTFEVLKVSGPRSWEIDRQLDCSETT